MRIEIYFVLQFFNSRVFYWDLIFVVSAYVTNLHSMEHKGPYQDDKFYSRPANHVTVHGGAIPIQQPPQVFYLPIKNIFKN